jgi:hypothetical protein
MRVLLERLIRFIAPRLVPVRLATRRQRVLRMLGKRPFFFRP